MFQPKQTSMVFPYRSRMQSLSVHESRRRIISGLALLIIVGFASSVYALPLVERDRHAVLERIGHGYVYQIDAKLSPPQTQADLLRKQKVFGKYREHEISKVSSGTREAIGKLNDEGFTLVESVNRNFGTDFQAIVVRDNKTGEHIISFRGTDSFRDLADDTGEVGSIQYARNRELMAEWAKRYPNATVTGHSLGGALAQQYIADHPDAVKEAVLFNSPGASKESAKKYRDKFGGNPPKDKITYYMAMRDLVSEYGGEEHLYGRVRIATGGAVDPSRDDTKVLAEHRGQKLQGDPDVKITEVDFDTYQRNRRRNDVDGLKKQLGDTVFNRKYVPHWLRETYNYLNSNHPYADDFSGFEELVRERRREREQVQTADRGRNSGNAPSYSGSFPGDSGTARIQPWAPEQPPRGTPSNRAPHRFRDPVIQRVPGWFE